MSHHISAFESQRTADLSTIPMFPLVSVTTKPVTRELSRHRMDAVFSAVRCLEGASSPRTSNKALEPTRPRPSACDWFGFIVSLSCCPRWLSGRVAQLGRSACTRRSTVLFRRGHRMFRTMLFRGEQNKDHHRFSRRYGHFPARIELHRHAAEEALPNNALQRTASPFRRYCFPLYPFGSAVAELCLFGLTRYQSRHESVQLADSPSSRNLVRAFMLHSDFQTQLCSPMYFSVRRCSCHHPVSGSPPPSRPTITSPTFSPISRAWSAT